MTLEEISKPGTILGVCDKFTFPLYWRRVSSGDKAKSLYKSLSDGYISYKNNNILSKGVCIIDGITHILYERDVYTGGVYGVATLEDLKSIGVLDEELPSIYEVGKWYKFKEITNLIVKFKSLEIKSNCTSIYGFNFTESIRKDVYSLENNWVAVSNIPELIDLSEIQQYLPEGHPDKIKSNKMEYKFKIGDKVKVIRSGYGCASHEVGTEVEIIEYGFYTGNQNGYKVSPAIGNTKDGVYDGFIGENSFELVENTWAEGGYVVAIKQGHANSKPNDIYQIGDIHNVTRCFYDNTFGASFSVNCCKCEDFKFFNTFDEATKFSKSLKTPVKEFKKGDYIVTLKTDGYIITDCAKEYYCFKQRKDYKGISPEKDLTNSSTNCNSNLSFDKLKCLKDWRYATKEEIAEYDRIGKPYDVTTLNISLNNIIPNEYYVGKWNDNDGKEKRCIFRPTTRNLTESCYFINSEDEYVYSRYGCCNSKHVSFRKATQEEREWLNACIAADKFIPKENVLKIGYDPTNFTALAAIEVYPNGSISLQYDNKKELSLKVRGKTVDSTVPKRIKLSLNSNQLNLTIKLR